MSQSDYFLKVDGAPGESGDDKHRSEIECLSFGFGVPRRDRRRTARVSAPGKVSMQDFRFVMKACKAGPKLLLMCATGEHIPKAVLSCRKAGKEQQDYLVYTFYDLIISSYNEGGSGGSDPIPIQSVSFNFSKMEVEYKEQNADGSLAGVTKGSFDLKANKGA
ncbi:MAG: type VI secretion system tube protein Hcp [Holophagales bacterium]|nr:type VI secretion system tube protein Hcp [Holophagales bacterium]